MVNRMKKNIKGSALLTVLILAFVVMIVVSSLAYTYKIGILSVNSLSAKLVNNNIDEGYIRSDLLGKDLSESHDETVGNARFITAPTNIVRMFDEKYGNAELYQATSHFVSYELEHEFLYGDVSQSTKDIIINEHDNNMYTQYEDDVLPLNVPFVNTKAMSNSLATYKLNVDKIDDNESGYIGYITKNNSTLNIDAGATSSSISVPNNLNNDYKFIVGWGLVNGHWNMYLSAYDDKHIHTSITTLRNLMDNSAQAQTDLNNWRTVGGVPAKNIILAKWYFSTYNEVPKLLILERQISGGAKARDLEFYETSYKSSSNSYTRTSTTDYETPASFDGDTVQAVVPDNLFTLDTNNILIQEGVNFRTYRPSANPELSSASVLSTTTQSSAVIARKNATDLYYVISDGNTYYQYNYAGGSINGEQTKTYYGQTISKIIVKFGALFVFTNQYAYINDFSTNQLNRIPIDITKQYQILKDGDGNGNGSIYLMPDGLDCVIAGSCKTRYRIPIEQNCATNGDCDEIAKLNDLSKILGMVYKRMR